MSPRPDLRRSVAMLRCRRLAAGHDHCDEAGWRSSAARGAHNAQVPGSNPGPATSLKDHEHGLSAPHGWGNTGRTASSPSLAAPQAGAAARRRQVSRGHPAGHRATAHRAGRAREPRRARRTVLVRDLNLGGRVRKPATGDPWLKHPTWGIAVRYWRGLLDHRGTLDCARCGRPITTARRTPWSLDVGHVVSRAEARARGWTVQQANALANTQPEHSRCSRSAGASDGNRVRQRLTITDDDRYGPPIESSEW